MRITTKGGVTIGNSCNVDRSVFLDGRGGLTIGDRVNVSPEAMFLTADHDPDSPVFAGRCRPVTVGSRSWVATRAVILPGSTVGEGVVVGAGAVVSGVVPDWTVVGGSPARELRPRPSAAQATLKPYRRWFH